MIRRRAVPDGLPFRVYERKGARLYSIGYKLAGGRWAFRYSCPIDDAVQITALRRQATQEATRVQDERPIGGFKGLVDAWFAWQEALPEGVNKKRAASTIRENVREAANLVQAFGHLQPSEITRTMGYGYLEACEATRPEKGNKEIALARLILEFGIRKGVLEENPLADLTRNRTTKSKRYVTHAELALAVEMGRKFGGARLIVALALQTAWLCVRRSVEVRGIMRDSIRDDGILWHDGKDRKKQKPPVLIEWSPELRATIAEALAIKRNGLAGSMYLFGNLQGQQYTKGGWKAILDDLMRECILEAQRRNMPFQKFSLQDCRPKGVSDKLERGDKDTQDATGHTDGKMISTVYDRRQSKKATPAG